MNKFVSLQLAAMDQKDSRRKKRLYDLRMVIVLCIKPLRRKKFPYKPA